MSSKISGSKSKPGSRLRGREPTSCELRESAGSSSGPYREDEGGRHILKTKRDVGPVDPGSSAYREDEGVLHTGMTKRGVGPGSRLNGIPGRRGRTAYRDDGDSVPPRPLAAILQRRMSRILRNASIAMRCKFSAVCPTPQFPQRMRSPPAFDDRLTIV